MNPPGRLRRGHKRKIGSINRIDGRQGWRCGVCRCSLPRAIRRHGGDDFDTISVPSIPSSPIGTFRGGIHRSRRSGALHHEILSSTTRGRRTAARGRPMMPSLGVEREFQPRVQLGPRVVVVSVLAGHPPASHAFEIPIHVE